MSKTTLTELAPAWDVEALKAPPFATCQSSAIKPACISFTDRGLTFARTFALRCTFICFRFALAFPFAFGNLHPAIQLIAPLISIRHRDQNLRTGKEGTAYQLVDQRKTENCPDSPLPY